MKKLLITTIMAGALLLGTAAPAYAGGSDSPTPYTVDQTGITLPEGQTFQDNGHVNIRTTDGTTVNLHFEGKCIERTDAECAGERHAAAQFIGKSFIPWEAFGLTVDDCVAWGQLSQYNEHFGEGGQPPVCLTPPVDPPATEKCLAVLWKAESVTSLWPQKIVAHEAADCMTFPDWEIECGTQYQEDMYADDAITAALIAGGVLYGPENPDESWPGGEYLSQFSNVWTTEACPPVVIPPVDPPVVIPPVQPPVAVPPVVPPVVVPPVQPPVIPPVIPVVVTPPVTVPDIVVPVVDVGTPGVETPAVVIPVGTPSPVLTPPVMASEAPVVLAATGVPADAGLILFLLAGSLVGLGLLFYKAKD